MDQKTGSGHLPELGPLPPNGPLDGYPRPPKFTVSPNARHGVQSTYARGCRCPHCTFVWREYRRVPVRIYLQRKAAERKLAAARALVAEADARDA